MCAGPKQEVECKNSADVNEIFDAISYSKGASVIRMLVSVLGLDAFQEGLRAYLKKHKYSNALSDDLWEALTTASGEDVKSLMNTWTRATGYPVLSLSLADDGDSIIGMQQRFFATGPTSEDTELWMIPLGCFGSHGALGEKIWSVKQGPIGATLSGGGGFIKANSQLSSVYRVGYSAELLAKLTPHVSSFTPTDRVGLVSDAFALAKAGYGDTIGALQLLSSFAGESSYIVLRAIKSGLSDLQSIMFQQPPEVRAGLKRFALKIFQPVMAKLGWDKVEGEPHEHSMLRPLALSVSGHAGDDAIECNERFGRYVDGDTSAIHPDLRDVVFGIVMKQGGTHGTLLSRLVPALCRSHQCAMRVGSRSKCAHTLACTPFRREGSETQETQR